MKRTFKITEDQLRKMVVLMNEQGNNAAPAREAGVKMVTTKIDADSLFPTGSSTPDPNNAAFQAITAKIVDSINNPSINKPLNVSVQGGASAVGSPKFNNKKLADDRAKNMIEYLIQNIGRQNIDVETAVKFNQTPSVVGVATVKDSPEAKKEQFVKVSYPTTQLGMTNPTTAVDRTATARRPMGDDKIVGVGGTATEVKLVRTASDKIVPMNLDTFKQINSILTKYGMYLSKNHTDSGKSL